MTKIREIKERELVSIITEIMEICPISNRPSLLVAAGKDDCAVIELSRSELLVASTDMLHSSTDFPAGMTPWQMGWMSMAVNLSDIAAMGARPIGVMAAMGLPPDLELDNLKELVEGMKACAETYGTHIIGGDIDRHDELTVVGSVLGSTEKEHLILRKGARIDDLVCVTGELGTAGAALDALKNDTNVDSGLVKKFYQPTPRIFEGMALARTGCVTSMMDISDGLALSLHDLAAASNVGFFIKFEEIPIHENVRDIARDDDQLVEWSIYTGGDFELLFTLKPECIEKAGEVAEFTIIGNITSDSITMQRSGRIKDIEARGFQQFGDNI
ncbi:MAG: thiamine-phosphate kinase [Methanosarcinales archaeon]|nr:thiamine-phosphate kinase [Methanosarcinales archaeon]